MINENRSWDVNDIAAQLLQLSNAIAELYDNPTAGLEIKKDLYLLKDLVDRALKISPNFGKPEEQWLTLREQKRIMNILKSK